jgi:hypothetical protein
MGKPTPSNNNNNNNLIGSSVKPEVSVNEFTLKN